MGKENFLITKWEGHLYDDGRDRVRESKYTPEEHELNFEAYDDDDNLYCTGTCKAGDLPACDLSDYLEEWGVVKVKLFDRKTGEFMDLVC